jgi:exopolysaccharide biosynthesis polyprenyl glycosylphosphotransferase
MFARRYQILGLQFYLHDLLLTLVAFLFSYLLRNYGMPLLLPRLSPLYPIRDYIPFLVGVLSLWTIIGHSLGLYSKPDPGDRVQLIRDAAVLVLVGSIAVLAGLYLIKASYVSRSFVLVFCLTDALFLGIGRSFFPAASAWLRERFERYRYFLIVGTGPSALQMASFLTQGKHLGQRLVGLIQISAAPVGGQEHDYPLFDLDHLPRLLENQIVDEVIIAVGANELEAVQPFIRRLQEEGVHTRLHLDFLPATVSQVFVEHFHDVPLLTFANTPANEVLLFVKRVFDVVLSVVALTIATPLMLVISAFIAAFSRGPILYRQTRCGVGGRRFMLYKFRTMVVGADQMRANLELQNELEGPVFKMANDPRCTPIGRWLRKFSLDELPQLWNILRGDMSFVGPRPPLPEEVEKYETWQRRRLRMRPGLTCLWALEGRNNVRFNRWMQLDLLYIENWSLWLDLKILIKTIPYVVKGSGAF